MLIITACSIAPVGIEGKKVDDFGVFLMTSFWATFAYFWMLFCLSINSPDEIEIWEAIVTFLCFTLLVVTSYMTARCT
jgi:solute carrier family 8 (sodium/calcium exchanger)